MPGVDVFAFAPDESDDEDEDEDEDVVDDDDESLFDDDESLFVESPEDEAVVDFFDPERLSVLLKPLPLKAIPTGEKTLRRSPPHAGHSVSGASENDWTTSRRSPQALQAYS